MILSRNKICIMGLGEAGGGERERLILSKRGYGSSIKNSTWNFLKSCYWLQETRICTGLEVTFSYSCFVNGLGVGYPRDKCRSGNTVALEFIILDNILLRISHLGIYVKL